VVITGAGDDEILAGPGNDVVNGGPGDDILVGDLPTPEMGLPPIEDTGPNFDVCIGAGGTDQAFTCEREVAIEPPVAARSADPGDDPDAARALADGLGQAQGGRPLGAGGADLVGVGADPAGDRLVEAELGRGVGDRDPLGRQQPGLVAGVGAVLDLPGLLEGRDRPEADHGVGGRGGLGRPGGRRCRLGVGRAGGGGPLDLGRGGGLGLVGGALTAGHGQDGHA
jgi:RTX calcium-binding nonapeptide repeat (4 copies)